MFLCDEKTRKRYLDLGDPIMMLIEESQTEEHQNFTSQRWLTQSLEKRLVYWHVYGDLFEKEGLKIVDVGGGYCSLSDLLAQRHDYLVVEVLAHDDKPTNVACEQTDWNEFDCPDCDLVIANDLFPNVDQRLELFLQKFLPQTRQMRLALTFYDNYKCYRVKRVDADEIFNIVAWDSIRLRRALERHVVWDLPNNAPSIFPNGRQVCILNLP